jgi:integrase
MPRLINRNPSYRKHKATGQAIVTIDGKDYYLGPWKTQASKVEYDRLVGVWLAGGRRMPGSGLSDITVTEVIARFWEHAQTYYRHPDGSPTSEIRSYKPPLAILNRLYGTTPARDFGPLALDAARIAMIEKGWVRRSINISVGRIKRMFKWAVAKELVPPSVHHALSAVAGLRAGRTNAQESDPVKPVLDATVDATLPFLSRTVAAMVQLQRLTGARPGEICAMRTSDIDRNGEIWTYTPSSHKTAHHGHHRSIFIGPKAQNVLKPFLRLDPAAYCFSPVEAERERREDQHAKRKTPANYGNNIGTNRKREPKRRPKSRYDVGSYCRAVATACELAFQPPPPLGQMDGESIRAWKLRLTLEQRAELRQWHHAHAWHPHQLRHSAATEIRKRFGIEAAQHVLGHATLNVTEIYAEKNAEAARQVAAMIG